MAGDTRSHVHALVGQLPSAQLAAVETLLRSMLNSLAKKLADAGIDDEPFTEEDRRAVAEAQGWSRHIKPIPRRMCWRISVLPWPIGRGWPRRRSISLSPRRRIPAN